MAPLLGHLRSLSAVLAPVALVGCAPVLGALRPGPEAAQREVRPDAPPEYDVLVAQQHEASGRLEEAAAAYERALGKDPDAAYLHRKLAEVLVKSNRFSSGLAHAGRALELDPDDSTTRRLLGHLHRVRGDIEAAEMVLLDASGDPFDEGAALVLYQMYSEAKRFEDALGVARWLIAQDPDAVRPRQALAAVYLQMDDTEQAERVLREALEESPGDLRLYALLARAYKQRGDEEGEMRIYREVLASHPDHYATLVALAEAQMAADDIDGAISTLEEIESSHPDDLRSVVRLGFLQYQARRFSEAAERFAMYLEANPEEYEVAFFLGMVRRRMGDEEGAIEAFERIPPDHKHYAEARTQLAGMYEREGEFEAALAEVRRAQKVKPSRALDLYGATLRAKAGDFDGAVAHLNALLEENPDDDELLYNLGVVYGEADRTEEAIRYMHRALESNPENASALNYIGYTWAERGVRLDEAEELITRALDLRPDDGYIVDSLGWVYYMRARPLVESGRLEEAKRHLERAVRELQRADELTGGDPVVSEHLGDTYLLLDDKGRALERFEEAIRLEPRLDEQPNLFDKFESLQRELQ